MGLSCAKSLQPVTLRSMIKSDRRSTVTQPGSRVMFLADAALYHILGWTGWRRRKARESNGVQWRPIWSRHEISISMALLCTSRVSSLVSVLGPGGAVKPGKCKRDPLTPIDGIQRDGGFYPSNNKSTENSGLHLIAKELKAQSGIRLNMTFTDDVNDS